MSDANLSRSAERLTVELRGQCAREIVDVLDAISLARDIERNQLVNQILGEWARQQVHEKTLLEQVRRGNPTAPESVGMKVV